MPVYSKSYREYEGHAAAPGRRWRVMVGQELRILFSSRLFVSLLIAGLIMFLMRLFQVVLYNMVSSSANANLYALMRSVTALQVDTAMFFDFLRMQSSVVFLACLYAGAGMICNDAQDNLLDVYFSKPLRRGDYIAGKVFALCTVGMMLTGIPALFLLLVHNLTAPGWATITDTYSMLWAIPLFSLALVLPVALAVLASSSVMRSERYAAVAIFMLVAGNVTLGTVLPGVIGDKSYHILAFPLAVNRLGEVLFQQRRPLFDIHWFWALAYVIAVCLVSYWLLARRVRRAESAV